MSQHSSLLKTTTELSGGVVPYTGRATGLPASLRRPGGCARLNLRSGQFRQHDMTREQARDICAAITAANQEREGRRDPKNCMGGWVPA